MQKIFQICGLLGMLLVLASCGDRESEGVILDMPTSNHETLEKFLPADVQIIGIRPHPNGHDRIGILFVSDQSLDLLKRFYVEHFEQCRIDIDLEPNLCISVFENGNLPAIVTAGRDESSNKEFVRVFVSEEDWNAALETGAMTIGVLAVESRLLPDGINKARDSTS